MELRKDYILDRWVLIASGRGKRPKQFAEPKDKSYNTKKTCFFCPGNEEFTPKEIGRLPKGKNWRFRWFPNKFPSVEMKGSPLIKRKGLLTHAGAYGSNEVIAETPHPTKQLWELPKSDFFTLFKIYRERIKLLSKGKGIKYVLVFKNHGKEGGTSLIHSHSQVAATSIIPTSVKQEISAQGKSCKYCKVVDAERKSARKCFENKSAVAFTPYASRYNFEVWIFPKKHLKSLDDFSDAEMKDFSELLQKVLSRLKILNISYNYFLHYSPVKENLHFHVEVTPRKQKWAGFEIGSGIVINQVSPEDAAKFYKKK